MFIREITLTPPADAERYPFNLPAIAKLTSFDVCRPVTFIVGQDGSGKSTLLHAIGMTAGLEGAVDEPKLWRHMRLIRDEPRPHSGGLLTAADLLDPGHVGHDALYLLDEPEAGLPISVQLQLVRRIDELTRERSQFIIATHSAVVLSLPGAQIYEAGEDGLVPVDYEQTTAYQTAEQFMTTPVRLVDHVLGPE